MITVQHLHRSRYIPVAGTVLESLEKSSVPIESHCRDGFCGACRVKLKRGEVKYDALPLAFVNDDEILTCCSIPTTEIEIEVL